MFAKVWKLIVFSFCANKIKRNAIPNLSLVDSLWTCILDLAQNPGICNKTLFRYCSKFSFFAWHRRHLDQRRYYKSNHARKRGILRNATISYSNDLHSRFSFMIIFTKTQKMSYLPVWELTCSLFLDSWLKVVVNFMPLIIYRTFLRTRAYPYLQSFNLMFCKFRKKWIKVTKMEHL